MQPVYEKISLVHAIPHASYSFFHSAKESGGQVSSETGASRGGYLDRLGDQGKRPVYFVVTSERTGPEGFLGAPVINIVA